MNKPFILTVCFSCFIIIASAQKQDQFDSSFLNRKLFKNKKYSDSLFRKFTPNTFQQYSQPLAGSMPKKFYYRGNNGAGFNIYQNAQDNMFILKPDSTFISKMPNPDKNFMKEYPIQNKTDSLQNR